MTNRDLTTRVTRPSQITTEFQNPDMNLPGFPAAAAPPPQLPPEERPPLFFTVLRKRWWVLTSIFLISGVLSYFVAKQYRSVSAQIEGSLIYNGLPIPPGPTVYQSPSLHTYKELLFSANNYVGQSVEGESVNEDGLDKDGLVKLLETHEIQLPPDHFTELFEVKVLGRSSIMELTFNWPDLEEGIELMNGAMDALIKRAVMDRRRVITAHLDHTNKIIEEEQAKADDASKELDKARKKYEDELQKSGFGTERYSDALKRKSDAESLHATKEIELMHIGQQITLAEKDRQSGIATYQSELVKQRQLQLDLVMKQYNEQSTRYAELAKLKKELDAVDTSGTISSLAEWETAVGRIGLTTLGPLNGVIVDELAALKGNLTKAEQRIDDLRLRQTSLQSHLDLLKSRLATYEDEIVAMERNGEGPDSSVVTEKESALSAITARLELYQQQRENMKQLSTGETCEFSVLVPASLSTATVSSNTKKLFAMSFFACSLALIAPVFLIDFMVEREAPVAAFAKRWNLPLMTERILGKSHLNRNKAKTEVEEEAIRMAALQIQQSLLQSSSVVIFSGLGDTTSPSQLLGSLSDCLANRGERVLLVDAVDHLRPGVGSGGYPLSELVEDAAAKQSEPADGDESQGTEMQVRTGKGLCDIFSSDPPDIADLIQHTENPCVDVITSGESVFPVEAMASDRLTELLMDCQRSYSLIFVISPPVSQRADFQMLAARADAIVLTGDNRSVKQSCSSAAIRALIELQAPVIGMMA